MSTTSPNPNPPFLWTSLEGRVYILLGKHITRHPDHSHRLDKLGKNDRILCSHSRPPPPASKSTTRDTKAPEKPVALVVTPLIELGNAHAREITTFGLRAVSVTAESLLAASREGRNLFQEIRQCLWSIVLMSAERLASHDFEMILQDETFQKNLVLFGIDETHLLVPWGKDFREAYSRISALRLRLPKHTSFVAVTATLSKGDDYKDLLKELKFKSNEIACIRLSSEQLNIRTVFLNLSHTLGRYTFPDISWVFRQGVKAVVFCSTIDLCFHVAVYGWSLYPEGVQRLLNVRLWSSITSAESNQRTLELFNNREDTSVIIATIAFGMGMNLRTINTVINLGLPSSFSALVQQNGRTGRNPQISAQSLTYIEPSIITALQEQINPPKRPTPTSANNKKRFEDLDRLFRPILLSYGRRKCIVAPINTALGNESPTSSLSCLDAGRPLPCSSCEKFNTKLLLPPQPPHYLVPPLLPPPTVRIRKSPTVGLRPAWAKSYRDNAQVWLNHFATTRWLLKTDLRAQLMPPAALWSGVSIDFILTNFHRFNARESLNAVLDDWAYLDTDGDALFEILDKLNHQFDEHLQAAKKIRARKNANTRAKKAAQSQPSPTGEH
ncbi:hypothetical protein NLJ89_g1382 [Agrocybe chaxingu]|uniref:DNA 3'-5' helicase n=1 Tax=Agrocybe chaxingu TaxID=84603 RepID=A0A9W8TFC1_9AGAR|nr:hypothetical protein NLJ89_g1382 [Agrocybe chaxingu]